MNKNLPLEKHFLFLLSIVSSFFLLNCEKEEPNASPKRVRVISPRYEGPDGIPDIDLYFYKTEQDYLTNSNAFATVKTDKLGHYFVRNDLVKSWIRAKKDSLNNLRYGYTYIDLSTVNSYDIVLSTTPTKLNLKILKDGAPQKCIISLFASEEDYSNNIPLGHRIDLLEPIYRSNVGFIGYADETGIYQYNDLEPRQYWFKIYPEHSEQSIPFKTTINKTPLLEDNAEVITYLEVGIVE